jgi:hypothetical protein
MTEREFSYHKGEDHEILAPLLEAKDVAKILGIAPKTVHKRVRQRKLACVQESPKIRRFTREQVQAYIDSQIVEVQIDRRITDRVKSAPPKGGEKSSRVFNRADLLKEIRSWQ